MTQNDFKALPYLLLEHQVAALGYDRRTVAKFADCGVLLKIEPKGSGHARYQKRQLAQLLGLEATLEFGAFRQEPLLMSLKSVRRWTGFDPRTLGNIVAAGGLRRVQPPGASQGKYLKNQIAKLIGFEA